MSKQSVFCTTSEVAEHYQVDSSTVRRWVSKGLLTPALTTPGGHHRFSKAALPEDIEQGSSTIERSQAASA